MSATFSTKPIIDYPDSDGERMSDNTLQFDWIAILKWNAESYFRDDPLVFVAGDHLIYTVEGEREIRQAPDVYVAFGRRKGYRGSYMVWEEDNVFPQVVFEVWSPINRVEKMNEKFKFYEKYGAEEYYILYPDFPAHMVGWIRRDDALVPIPQMNGFVSPRLGFRFAVVKGDVKVYGPDSRELGTPTDVARDLDNERKQTEFHRQRAESEKQRAEEQRQRADRLAEKLRGLGIDPNAP